MRGESKGGQSATGMYSYVQYLFGVPVVVTVDLEAPDAHLVQEGNQLASSWLQKNGVFVRLPAGEAFYDKEQLRVTAGGTAAWGLSVDSATVDGSPPSARGCT